MPINLPAGLPAAQLLDGAQIFALPVERAERHLMEERFAAQLKLANMPRNSSKTRVRNRCEITGRPRAFYRKMKICRNQLRELASQGMIPGMVKSSW